MIQYHLVNAVPENWDRLACQCMFKPCYSQKQEELVMILRDTYNIMHPLR